jgi:hypothetical protein
MAGRKVAGSVQHTPGGQLIADGNYFPKHDGPVKKGKSFFATKPTKKKPKKLGLVG